MKLQTRATDEQNILRKEGQIEKLTRCSDKKTFLQSLLQ